MEAYAFGAATIAREPTYAVSVLTSPARGPLSSALVVAMPTIRQPAVKSRQVVWKSNLSNRGRIDDETMPQRDGVTVFLEAADGPAAEGSTVDPELEELRFQRTQRPESAREGRAHLLVGGRCDEPCLIASLHRLGHGFE